MRTPRRLTLVATLLAVLIGGSLLAPALGAPRAVSLASLAKKVDKTLKIAKRADRNADRALAQDAVPGPAGSPGAKGDKGDACLASDPACQGPQGDPGPSAQRIDVSVDNASSSDLQVTGGFTLRFACSGDAAHRLFTLGVPAGTGGVQIAGVKTISDTAGSTIPFATGAGVPAGQFVGIGVGQPNPNNTSGFFYRFNGSMVLHNGLTVTTVVFDMFLENRSNQGTCLFRGTAVPSG